MKMVTRRSKHNFPAFSAPLPLSPDSLLLLCHRFDAAQLEQGMHAYDSWVTGKHRYSVTWPAGLHEDSYFDLYLRDTGVEILTVRSTLCQPIFDFEDFEGNVVTGRRFHSGDLLVGVNGRSIHSLTALAPCTTDRIFTVLGIPTKAQTRHQGRGRRDQTQYSSFRTGGRQPGGGRARLRKMPTFSSTDVARAPDHTETAGHRPRFAQS